MSATALYSSVQAYLAFRTAATKSGDGKWKSWRDYQKVAEIATPFSHLSSPAGFFCGWQAPTLFAEQQRQKISTTATMTAANTPAASTPAASTPAASTPAASTPAASTPAASTPTASTPGASTPGASTPGASTPGASRPAAVVTTLTASHTPAASTPTANTPAAVATAPTAASTPAPVLDFVDVISLFQPRPAAAASSVQVKNVEKLNEKEPLVQSNEKEPLAESVPAALGVLSDSVIAAAKAYLIGVGGETAVQHLTSETVALDIVNHNLRMVHLLRRKPLPKVVASLEHAYALLIAHKPELLERSLELGLLCVGWPLCWPSIRNQKRPRTSWDRYAQSALHFWKWLNAIEEKHVVELDAKWQQSDGDMKAYKELTKELHATRLLQKSTSYTHPAIQPLVSTFQGEFKDWKQSPVSTERVLLAGKRLFTELQQLQKQNQAEIDVRRKRPPHDPQVVVDGTVNSGRNLRSILRVTIPRLQKIIEMADGSKTDTVAQLDELTQQVRAPQWHDAENWPKALLRYALSLLKNRIDVANFSTLCDVDKHFLKPHVAQYGDEKRPNEAFMRRMIDIHDRAVQVGMLTDPVDYKLDRGFVGCDVHSRMCKAWNSPKSVFAPLPYVVASDLFPEAQPANAHLERAQQWLSTQALPRQVYAFLLFVTQTVKSEQKELSIVQNAIDKSCWPASMPKLVFVNQNPDEQKRTSPEDRKRLLYATMAEMQTTWKSVKPQVLQPVYQSTGTTSLVGLFHWVSARLWRDASFRMHTTSGPTPDDE